MINNLCVLICVVCCIGCSNRAKALPGAPTAAVVAPPIDRLDLFVRNAAREAVELTMTRDTRGTTVTLVRPAFKKQPPIVLDSIGPDGQDTDMVIRTLNSFDLWALNAPDAPGAACRTVMGQRSCSTFNDYSLVMRVQSGREVRVQRYTRLEKSTSNRSARALGDFVFEWARTRERQGKRP